MRAILALVALGSLAACEPAEGPAQSGSATQNPAPSDAAAPTIPEAFHGVWDYVEGTCARESDLRMEIAASQIVFYEAVGSVQSVRSEGEEEVTVALLVEGEGEIWETEYYLFLANDGDEMIARYKWGDQARDAPPRKRCPQ